MRFMVTGRRWSRRHGGSVTWSLTGKIARFGSEGYALVRYDRLGVGMSDRDVRDRELTLEGEVALLRAVFDELALDRLVLVGGSSGGCAAIAFAARVPEPS